MARNVHWRPHESSNKSSNSNSTRNSTSTSTSTATTSTSPHSRRSYETAPTDFSDRPSLSRNESCNARLEDCDRQLLPSVDAARASVDTYVSTSDEDNGDDDLDDLDDLPEYAVPECVHAALSQQASCAIPTTPRDFADLFPTAKRISIRHDDSTIDGNMNLRVDTQVEERHHQIQSYTLFHLRMHDLRARDFSLRRYSRDSGREVCHSIRKYQKPPAEKRPVLQRASTALASLKLRPESRPTTAAGLKRSDSGYESMHGFHNEDDSRPRSAGHAKGHGLIPTNTLKLEFSNYAHIDVKRRGAQSNKRYTFEHWGEKYAWKRLVQQEHHHEYVTYYLVRSDNEKRALAHISPVKMTPDQAREEAARGGWIPPCYMRITDKGILAAHTDISDVVVATGLMALVDDCIKRHFHSKKSAQIHIPLTRNSSFKMEYIGPKRLIDEVFNRTARAGTPSRHPTTSRRAPSTG